MPTPARRKSPATATKAASRTRLLSQVRRFLHARNLHDIRIGWSRYMQFLRSNGVDDVAAARAKMADYRKWCRSRGETPVAKDLEGFNQALDEVHASNVRRKRARLARY